jgi:hypothetical protein
MNLHRTKFCIERKSLKHGKNYVICEKRYGDLGAPVSTHYLWNYRTLNDAKRAVANFVESRCE